MSSIKINHDTCTRCGHCLTVCPFNALEMNSDKIEVNAGCRVCKICIKQCPANAISLETDEVIAINKDEYRDTLVFVEHFENKIDPVAFELIGEAQRLMKVTKQNVHVIVIGHQLEQIADELLNYGLTDIHLYDDPSLINYDTQLYANIFTDCVESIKPSTILIGATAVGRSLAPRLATRFNTGLTADCTVLQMKENTDLVQIRPAFGGNIMAQIITTNHRPQMATVRYQVMEPALKQAKDGNIIKHTVTAQTNDQVIITEVLNKAATVDISQADLLVVAGAAIHNEEGLQLIIDLADALGGNYAVTRPLVEAGLATYHHQVGLSGRTVKPKVMIVAGASGAIQFVAGMENTDLIVSINTDANAPIMEIANIAVVGDLYQIIPNLIDQIKGGQNV